MHLLKIQRILCHRSVGYTYCLYSVLTHFSYSVCLVTGGAISFKDGKGKFDRYNEAREGTTWERDFKPKVQ